MSTCRKCDACGNIIGSTTSPVAFAILFSQEGSPMADGRIHYAEENAITITSESGDVCSKACAKIVLDRALDRINKARL